MKRSCPVCNSPKLYQKFNFGNLILERCKNCTFEFIPPSKTKQDTIYTEGYYSGELSGAKGYEDYNALEFQLIKEAQKKIDFIKLFTKKINLLDIGAGTGVFLTIAKQHGLQVSGNDISSYAVKQLKKSKINTYLGSIEKNIFPKEKFNIITAWDVIEHVNYPQKAIKTIHRGLKPNGFLFMTTPDTQSIDSRILGKYWYGYKKIPEHVGFFNKQSLSKLLKDHGFKIIEIKPWGFYRNLDFVLSKLSIYSSLFSAIRKLLQSSKLQSLNFFIPLTDCIIVAQKI